MGGGEEAWNSLGQQTMGSCDPGKNLVQEKPRAAVPRVPTSGASDWFSFSLTVSKHGFSV